MNIRSRTPSDDQAIAELNRLAFKWHNEAKLVESIRQTDRYIPELEMVAELDCGIVGHILLSYIDLVEQESLRVIGLAPMAVRPEFQKQGFGSALVQAGLETASSLGESMVIVLGSPQFYSRFGFEPSVIYGIESPFEVPQEFFQVKPLKNYQERYRGKVIYPPAFKGV